MTREEQIQFVIDLTDSVRAELIIKIINEKIPEDWDGIELRKLLSLKFEREARFKMSRSRMMSFNNTLYTENI